MTNRSPDDLDRDHTDELPVLLETVAQRDEEDSVFASPRPDDTAQHAALHAVPSQSAGSTSELLSQLAERSDEIAILQSQIASLADRGRELEQDIAAKDERLHELEQTVAALRQSTEDALAAERRLAAQVAVRDGRIAELTAELERLREASAARDAETKHRAAADSSEPATDQQPTESPAHASSPATAREVQRLLEEKAALSDYIAGRRARWEESQAREASLGARVAALEKELTAAGTRAEEAEAFATRESGRAVSLRSELVDSARRVAELERQLKAAAPALGPATSAPAVATMTATVAEPPIRPQAAGPKPAAPTPAEVPVVSEIVEAAPQAVEAVAQLEAEVEYKRQQVAAQLVELRDRDQQIRSSAGDLEQVRRELGALRLELEQSRSAASRLERAVIDKDRALDARDARITTLQEELKQRLRTESLHAADVRPTRLEPLPTRATTLDVGTEHAPAPVLICLTGDAPKRFALTKKSIVVGRGAHCDLQIITHVVSREHARITIDEGIAIIEDVGSRNGVFVNSVRVDRQALQQGDLITIGDAQFRFIDSMAH
jgi:hypothetical protein